MVFTLETLEHFTLPSADQLWVYSPAGFRTVSLTLTGQQTGLSRTPERIHGEGEDDMPGSTTPER